IVGAFGLGLAVVLFLLAAVAGLARLFALAVLPLVLLRAGLLIVGGLLVLRGVLVLLVLLVLVARLRIRLIRLAALGLTGLLLLVFGLLRLFDRDLERLAAADIAVRVGIVGVVGRLQPIFEHHALRERKRDALRGLELVERDEVLVIEFLRIRFIDKLERLAL